MAVISLSSVVGVPLIVTTVSRSGRGVAPGSSNTTRTAPDPPEAGVAARVVADVADVRPGRVVVAFVAAGFVTAGFVAAGFVARVVVAASTLLPAQPEDQPAATAPRAATTPARRTERRIDAGLTPCSRRRNHRGRRAGRRRARRSASCGPSTG